jgi:hypothetical protein
LGKEAPGGQLPDQALIDRGLEFEIEIVERLDRRKVRDLEAHGDPRPLLGVDLLAQHAVKKVEIGGLGAGRVIEDGIQAVRHIPESEPGKLLDDARMHHGPHRSPPVTIAA